MNQVSIDKRKLIDNELNPDESLRWCAEPDPARHAKKGIPLFLKGIFFTAFAFFWMYAASGFNMPLFSAAGLRPFPLFGWEKGTGKNATPTYRNLVVDYG